MQSLSLRYFPKLRPHRKDTENLGLQYVPFLGYKGYGPVIQQEK